MCAYVYRAYGNFDEVNCFFEFVGLGCFYFRVAHCNGIFEIQFGASVLLLTFDQ